MNGWSKLKKTAVISAVAIFGLSGLGAITDQKTSTVNPKPSPPVAEPITPPQVKSENTQQPETPVQNPPATQPESSPVSNPAPSQLSCPNGTYVNTDGITVCSPYSAPATPAGATARCGDGTYSFSLHRSGTCSHHGGVSEWL